MRDIPDKVDGNDYLPEEFNSFKDESRNVVITSDQTLSEADSFQVSKGISNYAGVGDFYVQTGVADAYVLSAISPFKAPSQLFDGLVIRTRIVDSNTGASTLNWNGTGAKAIKKNRGTDDLAPGDLITDDYPIFIYEQSGDIWELITEPIQSNYPLGYLKGFYCERDSGDTDHDIKISEGAARGENDYLDIKIPKGSSIIKQIDANWAEGTNQGGFPSGLTLTADTWYHFFSIVKSNGQVDAGYDSNLDASVLLADATNYKDYKRVWSVRTDGSLNIKDAIMYIEPSGTRITLWKTMPPAFYKNSGFDLSRHNVTVETPLGIQSIALLRVHYTADTIAFSVNIFSPSLNNQLPSKTSSPGACYHVAVSRVYDVGNIDIITDTSSQISYIQDSTDVSNIELLIATRGWQE